MWINIILSHIYIFENLSSLIVFNYSFGYISAPNTQLSLYFIVVGATLPLQSSTGSPLSRGVTGPTHYRNLLFIELYDSIYLSKHILDGLRHISSIQRF